MVSSLHADFAAGITAGAVTTLVVHPLDLIKVRLQVDSSSADVRTRLRNAVFPPQPQSTDQVLRTARSQVVKSLYRGLPVNLVGNTLSWGMYFSLYHHFKAQLIPGEDGPLPSSSELLKWTQNADASTLYLACALAAGTSTSLLTNPIWVLKTRYLSTTSANTLPSSSSTTAAPRINVRITDIIKNEGVQALWRGFVPSLFGVMQGSLQFSIYDELKTRRLRRHRSHLSLIANDTHAQHRPLHHDRLSQWEYIVLSASSKVIATVALYPYQLVRSRLQMGAPTGTNSSNSGGAGYKNARDVIAKTIKYEGGIRSLYKGLGPNLLRVVPSTTITFVVYENVQHWLKHE